MINSETVKPIIVLDLGGVILDFDHLSICSKLSALCNLSPNTIYEKIFSSGLEKLYDEGRISSEEFFRLGSELLNLDISFVDFIKIWVEIFSENINISNLLRQLKIDGYKLYLLSNTNVLHFDYCYHQFDILKIFDKYILSYKVGARKPDKEIFSELIKTSGQHPSLHLFIDDRIENVEAAIQFGLHSIQYLTFEKFYIELKLELT